MIEKIDQNQQTTDVRYVTETGDNEKYVRGPSDRSGAMNANDSCLNIFSLSNDDGWTKL